MSRVRVYIPRNRRVGRYRGAGIRRVYRRKAPLYRMRAAARNAMRSARNRITNVKFRIQLPFIENGSSVVTGSPADIPFHFSVIPNTLPNWAGYSRIHQQYRVVAIKIEFLPTVGDRVVQNVGTSSTPITQLRPLVVTYVNRAGTNFIQNVNQGLSVPYAKMHTAGQKITRYFKCATYDQAYRPVPAVTDAQNVEYKQWFPTSTSADVPHEGLDMVIGAAESMPDGFFKYRPIVTAYVQFKGRQMVNTLGP